MVCYILQHVRNDFEKECRPTVPSGLIFFVSGNLLVVKNNGQPITKNVVYCPSQRAKSDYCTLSALLKESAGLSTQAALTYFLAPLS